jgi:hypothetical protein
MSSETNALDDDPLDQVAKDEQLIETFAQAEEDSRAEDGAFLAIIEARHHTDYRTAGASRPGGTHNLSADRADDIEQAWAILEWLRPKWHERAACRGQAVERFYPTAANMWRKIATKAKDRGELAKGRRASPIETYQGPQVEAVKKICRACPVRAHCLAGALARRERFGLWGGLTPNERAALLKTGASPFAILAEVQRPSGQQGSEEQEATEAVA